MAGKDTGFTHLFRALGYSIKGLKVAFAQEAAFRHELALFILLAPLGIWLGNNGTERALLIGSLILVLIVELINSAIEAVVDRHGTERHTLSGQAKDLGSAAVMVANINVIIIWALILID